MAFDSCPACGRSTFKDRQSHLWTERLEQIQRDNAKTIGTLRQTIRRLNDQLFLLRTQGVLGTKKSPGNPPSHIYIIGRLGDEHLKIGISNDPQQRCRTLSNGPDQDLRVLFQEEVGSDRARRIERHCHQMLKTRRAEAGFGREWFRIEIEEALRYVRDAIASVKD